MTGTRPARQEEPGVLILLDARERATASRPRSLATLKTKWVDSGKQVRVEKIRDVEFTVLIFKQDDVKKSLGKVFPDAGWDDAALEPPKPGDAEKGKNMELIVGQSARCWSLARWSSTWRKFSPTRRAPARRRSRNRRPTRPAMARCSAIPMRMAGWTPRPFSKRR